MMAEASGSRPVVNTEFLHRRRGSPGSGRAPLWILRRLLLLILTPALFIRNRRDGCAAADLLPDTSRTTGVLGVAICLARPQARLCGSHDAWNVFVRVERVVSGEIDAVSAAVAW